ncbi:MAG: hypothetical protein A3G28_00395 [Betaproteobacteria bacterium RIFCSPLOWO2_12_FULL_68_19]|nr:MAG: hypothetical protein A3G28_00395 [Betaproteobacteria bacterium RIFCSPLOWO2_12_FULL_68_19]
MRKLLLCAAAALSGCATITEGTSQTLSFSLEPAEAQCTVQREGDGVLGELGAGANALTVRKARQDITVACRAPGYEDATVTIASAASAAGLASAVLLDFGITDMATGAFWKYPETHSVVLVRSR